jgi:hypothetical protein
MRAWLIKAGVVSGVVALLAVVAVLVVQVWVGPPTVTATDSSPSIETAWAEAIQRFGIEPVFPPEEDLAVGDVLAVVVADRDPDQENKDKTLDVRSPFLRRSVKLAHIDVREPLEKTYAMLPTFPAGDRPAAVDVTGAIAGAKAVPDAIGVDRPFTRFVPESHLPRAAFTSLKIQGTSSATAGFSVLRQGSAGYGASNQGIEELHLIGVSTYGLPSVRAAQLLKTYCTADDTKTDCSQATARRHLRPIVGDRIFAEYFDPQGKIYHPLEVDIVMVNRVYLARAIVHMRRAGSTQGGSARIMAPRNDDGVAAEAATAALTPQDVAALKKRLDDLEKQVARARAGGALAFESSFGSEMALDERLDRPVAFGYRSVRLEDDSHDGK